MSPLSVPAPRVRGTLHLTVFLTIVAGIAFAAYRSYLQEEKVFREGLHSQLDEIASLKLNQIYNWQLERRGDATMAARNASLMPELEEAAGSHPTTEAKVHVSRWLNDLRTSYRYAGTMLLDSSGAVRIATGQVLAASPFYEAIARDMTQGDLQLTYYPRDRQVMKSHFVLLARLHSHTGRVYGTIIFTSDPWDYPFPFVLHWPSPTETGSVFFVRPEGEGGQKVRIVGFQPGKPDQPLESITAISDRSSLFVRALSIGNGIVDGPSAGVTYAAVARTRTIGSRPTTVLSMIDQNEAYQPLRQTRTLFALVSGLLIVICGAGVGWIWRQQVLHSFRQQLEAERVRRALIGHYDYLARFANDAIFLEQANGAIVQVNERASDFYGYAREELLQMTMQQLRGANTEADHERARLLLEKKNSSVYETTNLRKDGTTFPVELSVRTINIEGTEYRQTIIRDITERRRAEQHIDRLNRLYAVLSRCGQAIVKAPGELALFQEVCSAAVESGGFRIAAIRAPENDTGPLTWVARAGDASDYLVEAPDPSPMEGMAGESLRESGAFACNDLWEEPSMAPARESSVRFNVRSLLILQLWRGGRPAGEMRLYSAEPGFFSREETELATEIAESICFALESLERKKRQQKVEDELRLNRERLELVLDATDEAYWDWDMESGEVEQSPRYDAMLGYGPLEVPRGYRSWLAMIHPDDRDRLEREFGDFRTSRKTTLASEFRMRRKSGEYIWVSSRGKVVGRDPSGNSRRMVGTLTDVTDRKKLEEQFRQAQKLESVGRLAGGVAHDFNNLLTVINGYSGLLMAGFPLDDRKRRQFNEIRKAGERAADLTRQLLTFSRKQVFQSRLLKLNELVSDSENMLRRLLPDNVEFRTAPDAMQDAVVADPSQIHQVLMNLVVNACDAMPMGGKLTIRTATVEAEAGDGTQDSDITTGSYVLMAVTDTGTGMDVDTLRNIFEPFFTTKDVGKGTGLGLSTVYGIVRQCGGFVRVESAVGQGTTFEVHFPLAAEGILRPAAPKQVDAAELQGSETILVVEDQTSVRELAVDTLRAYGYSVLAAGGGPEALALAREFEGPIDLLLTDVVMPSMNGRTVAQQMREIRPATKVIYMSGYADEVVSVAGELGPETGYLQKPFAPDALAVKVRQALTHLRVPRTILVVEDEDAVRNLFAEVLGQTHTVLLAGDGVEAQRIMRSNGHIDLVVTDLVMPNQQGIELIRAVRRMRPGIRIIAMSGAFGGQFLRTAELLGADATLVKPVRPEVLNQVIEEVLGRPACSGVAALGSE